MPYLVQSFRPSSLLKPLCSCQRSQLVMFIVGCVCPGCPVLQSLMQACKARLEELTKSAPQKPKDWALDVKVECDAKHGPSAPAADGLCMNCCRLQDFLQDAARTVFTATLSRAEAQHLQG